MTTILSKQADIDLQILLDMRAEMPGGEGSFPNAPMDPKLAQEARKRLESEFSNEIILRALQDKIEINRTRESRIDISFLDEEFGPVERE